MPPDHKKAFRRATRYVAPAFFSLLILHLATGVAAAPTEVGFESLPGGTSTTDGMLLGSQYSSQGFTFEPTEGSAGAVVVDCDSSDTCTSGASADKAVTGLRRTEFRNYPVRISFDEPQKVVSVSVKYYDVSGNPVVTATLGARDGDGDPVDTDFQRFREDNGWQRFEVGNPYGSARIESVVVSGSREDRTPFTNYVLLDDLRFEGETESDGGDGDGDSGGETDLEPEVEITAPLPGETIDTRERDIDFRANDDVQLANVTARVVNPSGRVVTTTPNPICGTRFNPCPPGSEMLTVSRTQNWVSNGTYRFTVRACDLAGQCVEATRDVEVELEPLEPDPEVYAHRVEVNQAVQNRLWRPPGSGTADFASSSVPLVAGKDTVVRFYLFASANTTYSVGADLKVTVDRGSEADTFWVSPNTGQDDVDVLREPGTDSARERRLLAMRADVNSTVNYVIPGDRVPADTEAIQLNMEGRTGPLRIDLQGSPTFGMDLIALWDDGVMLPNQTRVRGLVNMHRSVMPVRDVLIPDGPVWRPHEELSSPWRKTSKYTGNRSCSDVLSWVRATHAGDASAFVNQPDYVSTVGLAKFGSGMLQGCSGKAYLSGTPSAISYVDTNVAPQEVVHTMGVTHASHYHDVRELNQGWEAWPYQHGQVSASNTYTGGGENFGVVAVPDGSDYRVVVIDPCPTNDPGERYPSCSIPDSDRHHDFMSYGRFERFTSLEGYFAHPDLRWTSDVTYERMYSKLRIGSLSPASDSLPNESLTSTSMDAEPRTVKTRGYPEPVLISQHSPSNESEEAFLFAAKVMEDGDVEPALPLLRKPVPSSMVHANSSADEPYTLTFRDGEDERLLRHSFDVEPATLHGSRPVLWEVVPYVAEAERLLVDREGERVMELEASPNPPSVEITSPNGGETLESGERSVAWNASDPDGDPLTFLVQYSSDGGESWQGINTLYGDARETEFEVDAYLPGTRGVVRVTASDGFNTAYDVSDTYFSLGTQDPPSEGGAGHLVETRNASTRTLGGSDGQQSPSEDQDAQEEGESGGAGAMTALLLVGFALVFAAALYVMLK